MAIEDSEWPMEMRKQIIRIPNDIYDCIQKVALFLFYFLINYLFQLVDYASKPSLKEPHALQVSIEQCLMQFAPDRKFPNPLMHFKVTFIICYILLTDKFRL